MLPQSSGHHADRAIRQICHNGQITEVPILPTDGQLMVARHTVLTILSSMSIFNIYSAILTLYCQRSIGFLSRPRCSFISRPRLRFPWHRNKRFHPITLPAEQPRRHQAYRRPNVTLPRHSHFRAPGYRRPHGSHRQRRCIHPPSHRRCRPS